MNKKGDVTWMTITLVLAAVAVVIAIVLLTRGAQSGQSITKCEGKDGYSCVSEGACSGTTVPGLSCPNNKPVCCLLPSQS